MATREATEVPDPRRPPAELLARVRLRLRGDDRAPEVTVLRSGELSLDLRTRRAQVRERTIDLAAREFVLLELFLRQPGQVLSREQILSNVWGRELFDGMSVFVSFVSFGPAGPLTEVTSVVCGSRVSGRGCWRQVLSVVGSSVRGVIRAFLAALAAQASEPSCGRTVATP